MRTIVISFVAAAILFLVNLVLPLTPSAYVLTMMFCILPLLWLSRHEGWNRSLLLLPWSVAFMASILVTRNFVYPDIQAARNTDVNILELSRIAADSTGYKKVLRVNFPKHGPEDARKRFDALVSTDIDQIMDENVDAAFHFCDRGRKLDLDFSGTISYTVGDLRQPLNAVMEVDSLSLAAQGWTLKIHDMRDTVKPTWCMALIIAMFLFILVMSFTCRTTSASSSMFIVWFVFIGMIVARLYIAVTAAWYPPLDTKTDIIFFRYRSLLMDNPMDYLGNPFWMTWIIVLFMAGCTLWFRWLSQQTMNIAPIMVKRMLVLCFVGMVTCIVLNVIGIGRVISHIAIPVSLFFLAEYCCLKLDSKYQFPCHLAIFVLTLISIAIGDNGYGLIFIIFLIALSLYLIKFYRSSYDEISTWKDGLWLVRLPLIACLLVLLFVPQYVILTIYKHHLLAFAFLVVVGLLIVFSIWTAGYIRKPHWFVSSVLVALFMAALVSYGGSIVLEKNPRIIYRAEAIAGTNVNDLLLNEPVERSFLVFRSTQNAWFLSEHLKEGTRRIFDSGIYKVQPYSRNVVSYETQLCDVLVSRHLIAGVSLLYPILLILTLLCLFFLVCIRRDASERHRILSFEIALFLIVEAIYVFLTNLNMTVFTGEDVSILSGIVKPLIETILLAYLCYGKEEPEENDETKELNFKQGVESVCTSSTNMRFSLMLLFGGGLLYAANPLEKSITPQPYSGKGALVEVQNELAPLNQQLRTVKTPRQKLRNGEDVSGIWDSLKVGINLEQLKAGIKSKLGKSMVDLFDGSLKYCNETKNKIYLKAENDGYKLIVNPYSWSYEMPNYENVKWHGNIVEKYATTVENVSSPTNANIPDGWQPRGEVITHKRALVRNVFVNGKAQSFYSLRDPWLRNLVDAGKSCLEGNEEVVLTLDATLQERINEVLQRTHTTSSVCVVNGLGEVMALSQNGPSIIDPNNDNAFKNQRIANQLGNHHEEDNILKNLNLDILNPGVGSSFKPIIAASAISMLGLRFDRFRIQSLGLSNNIEIRTKADKKSNQSKSYYRTWNFGNCSFHRNWPFESLVNDEMGGEDREVDFTEYLSMSSNYYNATLITMLLGSGDNIENIFHDAQPNDIPQVLFGNYRLGLNGWNTPIQQSYLSYCLEENFKFGNTNNHDDFLGRLTNDKTKKNYPLIHMRCAVMNETDLQRMDPGTRLQRLCTGSVQAFSLSPILMAELYGKIASGHSDYSLAMVPRDKTFSSLFRNYRGEEDSLIYQSFRNYLFPAMRECCLSGTASRWHLDNLWQHVYAKTGTLGGSLGRDDDRLLAIILADRPLENAEPGKARFVVAYFRYKNSPLHDIDQIVREIIGSRGFAEYMTLNE